MKKEPRSECFKMHGPHHAGDPTVQGDVHKVHPKEQTVSSHSQTKGSKTRPRHSDQQKNAF